MWGHGQSTRLPVRRRAAWDPAGSAPSCYCSCHFFFPAVEWSSDRSLSESEGWLCLWHGRGVVVGCRVAWLPGPGAKAERACCCVRAAAKVTRPSHSDSRGAVLAQALTQYARLSLSDKSSLVCGLLGCEGFTGRGLVADERRASRLVAVDIAHAFNYLTSSMFFNCMEFN